MTTPLVWTGAGSPPTHRRDRVSALHGGAVLVLPPTAASSALVRQVRARVRAALGVPPTHPWAEVQAIPSPYAALASVRAWLAESPIARTSMANAAASVGFIDTDAVDAPRLRSISAGAEAVPEAAPVYLLHRDTWYGCPDALLVAWTPLQDTPARDMFAFYPTWFDRPVPNTSGAHDHTRWMADVGWHGTAPLQRYSAPLQPVAADALTFDVPEGAMVLFSAAQLHQTRPVPNAPWTRFSVDFRLLPDPSDTTTRAPSVDNDSRGAAARVAAEFTAIGAVRSHQHEDGQAMPRALQTRHP